MFFIGAPIGALIRKGGFGLPVVLAFLIFLSYHFAGTFFKNSAEDGSISPLAGTTLPSLVLFLLSIMFIIRARADKGIFGFNNFISKLGVIWYKLFKLRLLVQNIFSKN